ncbi:MAG: flagellar basal body protein [Proteobacteria bacterium]|nr:flagellar basal body protein [Pseudomonadota bacterium]
MAEFAEALMIHDLPTFAALKERMRFLQTRQKLLAENVANADTPGFRPKDIQQGVDPASRGADQTRNLPTSSVGGGVRVAVTDPRHLGGGSAAGVSEGRGAIYETRPSGNSVDLENEMLKVSQNQIDFQTAANIYQRGLATLKIALGRKA